jgi:hydroxymethylpyrimidine/phosphomethylpyrimidine kinase
MRTALTIAGSDSSAGAGIQADLKTFAAHGVYAASAVTAITVQNTQLVTAVYPLPADLVAAQVDAVAGDFDLAATKIGMLASGEVADAVAEAITRHALRHVVLDTVLQSSSGTALIDAAGAATLRARLVPLAEVVTMNVPEAETLTGMRVRTVEDGRAALAKMMALGARAVVLKGGHFEGPPTDLLHDGRAVTIFDGERLAARHTHGTGCTFASAIAARLALGDPLVDAVRGAKAYVAAAIRRAPGLGQGRGPLGHFGPDGRPEDV